MILQSSYGFALLLRLYDLRLEIYISRLCTTMQIFIAMDYLIATNLREVPFFIKRKKIVASKFFSDPVEVTGSIHFGNLKEIGIIQLV